MLEFTKIYPLFFSVLPAPLRLLSAPTDQLSYECPTRISILHEPWFANLSIYLLYLVSDRPNVTRKIHLLLALSCPTVYDRVYDKKNIIIGCRTVIYGYLRLWINYDFCFCIYSDIIGYINLENTQRLFTEFWELYFSA